MLTKRALKVNEQEVYQWKTNEATNTQLFKKNSIKPKSWSKFTCVGLKAAPSY